ncbi:MAG: radical SAM family heme chaperone HemW [Thermovirgaceae bacterium]|nr:radical SAM family heme chaperone HemW [Thermovirgaceae bacterium]
MHFSRPAMRKKSRGEHSASLYVHIPFCSGKCPYCAFYSVRPGKEDVSRYLASLDLEISMLGRSYGTLPEIRTAFIGGGTPTVLDPVQWRNLLSLLESRFRFLHGAEVTVEANPNSIRQEHLDIWRKWRVTRVSVGVQSLNDGDLRALGRPHDSRQSLEAMSAVRNSGFSLSADLLFGLPLQDLRIWSRSLEGVLSAGAEHVSIYQLTLEKGTPWGDFPPEGLAEGYSFYRWAQYFLERRGLRQYEVASFAKPGKWCRHNVSYWQHRDVIGLGPSAWGYLNGVRTRNASNLDEYVSFIGKGDSPVCFSESLKGKDLASEAAILALRTRWGIRFERYRKRFGEEALRGLLEELDGLPPRLFRRNGVSVALSREGMRVGNAIWERLLP